MSSSYENVLSVNPDVLAILNHNIDSNVCIDPLDVLEDVVTFLRSTQSRWTSQRSLDVLPDLFHAVDVAATSPWVNLRPSLLENIFLHLGDARDIRSCRRVCKSWGNTVWTSRSLWYRAANVELQKPLDPSFLVSWNKAITSQDLSLLECHAHCVDEAALDHEVGHPSIPTPLNVACQSGNLAAVQFLIERCDAGPVDLVAYAPQSMYTDEDDDADYAERVCLGTSLQCAVVSNSVDVVRYLLQEQEADPNSPTTFADCGFGDGYDARPTLSPALLAVNHSPSKVSIDILELLGEAGADFNNDEGTLYNYDALTLLSRHFANDEDERTLAVVQCLVSHDANVNAVRVREDGGTWPTVLQCAAYHGYKQTVAWLLRRGADVRIEADISITSSLRIVKSMTTAAGYVESYLRKYSHRLAEEKKAVYEEIIEMLTEARDGTRALPQRGVMHSRSATALHRRSGSGSSPAPLHADMSALDLDLGPDVVVLDEEDDGCSLIAS